MFISVDVGATTTRTAKSDDGITLSQKESFPTPEDYKEGLSKILQIIDTLVDSETLEGVAIGVPGVINRKTGKVYQAPNLVSWNNQKVVEDLSRALSAPIEIANDAELACLGEATFGIAEEHRIVGYLTISTGIGGALVIDKKLVPRAYNSEPGHIVVELDGIKHPSTGQKGDWEMYASGTAFEERFRMSPEKCDDPGIWTMFARNIGQGVMNVLALWSPDVLVIGGGLSLKGEAFLGPLRSYLNENFKIFPPPPIVAAALGDDAGLYGGFALIRSKS